MAAASSTQHTPVRAATPDLIATYNIGATSADYCMSKSKKGSFEKKLEVDLTQLLQVGNAACVCLQEVNHDAADEASHQTYAS